MRIHSLSHYVLESARDDAVIHRFMHDLIDAVSEARRFSPILDPTEVGCACCARIRANGDRRRESVGESA